jgi:hypothetical protein
MAKPAKLRRSKSPAAHAQRIPATETSTGPIDPNKDKRLTLIIAGLLFLFGVYHSVIYFGHQTVPNSDFPAFYKVSEKIFAFEKPNSFKRLPGLGLFHIACSKLFDDAHPILSGGRFFNALLHPFSLVLLFLIGRKVLGHTLAALFLAMLAILNPWSMHLLTQPIVETPLMFFTLVSIYLILLRSWWCYLAVFLMSMIRYEGAAMILTALLTDLFLRKAGKQRLQAVGLAILAGLPLVLWILFAKLSKTGGSGVPYMKHFSGGYTTDWSFWDFLHLLWKTCFQSLLEYPAYVNARLVEKITQQQAEGIQAAQSRLWLFSQIAVVAGVLFGMIAAIVRKNRFVLPWLFYLTCYFAVHSVRHISTPRYVLPIVMLVMLITFYGWQQGMQFIKNKSKIPRVITVLLGVIAIVACVIWTGQLIPAAFSDGMAKISKTTSDANLLPVTLLLIILSAGLGIFFYPMRHKMSCLVLAAFFSLCVVSNHFTLAQTLSNGNQDKEFKYLADWYLENAPGEKMISTMPHLLKLFAPDHAKRFRATSSISGQTLQEFTDGCHERNITLLAWDSRLGFATRNSYYKKYGLERIKLLASGKTRGPYEHLATVKESKYRFIHIYRIHLKTPEVKK